MEPHAVLDQLEELGVVDRSRFSPFHPRVRDRSDIAVLRCPKSEVIALSRCDHVNLDHYRAKDLVPRGNTHHVKLEQGVVSTPALADDQRRAEEFAEEIRGRRWLDFGCGEGGILDLLSEAAREALGLEPNRELLTRAQARGRRVVDSIEALEAEGETFDVVSLFHVLEHLVDPVGTLRALRDHMAPGGRLIVEVPHARDFLITMASCPAFRDFTFWSEHLLLHTRASLQAVIHAAGFEATEVRGIQRYGLANHLHWLSEGKPGGHQEWASLSTPELDAAYTERLRSLDRTDTLVGLARSPA